jgi:hypothetical protein
MDTSTLIEWIQQQLETKEETEARHQVLKDEHQRWHQESGVISACCIKVGKLRTNNILTINETRAMTEKEIFEQAKAAFKDYERAAMPIMVVGPDVTITPNPGGVT